MDDLRTSLDAIPDARGLLAAIVAGAPVGLQICDASGRCVLVNDTHRLLFGGVPPPDYNIFEDTLLASSGVAPLVRRAFGGERISIPPISYDIRELRNIRAADPGRRLAVGAELVPLRDAAGDVAHVLFLFNDVTEATQARESAEVAAARASFLADASRVLASSLDYEATLARVARLATPTMADFCFVDIVEPGGEIRRVAAAHADRALQPLLEEIRSKYPPELGSSQPAALAIASRQPFLLEDIDESLVVEHARSPGPGHDMPHLGVRSHLAVPLILGERILGAISMGYSGERRYAAADIPLAEALASRAAVAIDNARLLRDAKAARAEAEAANRAKDEFLAMLGHELRNPLAPIVTALHITRLREGPSREREIIERQVGHLRRLVDDLLDVARIARGKLELDQRALELHEAVVQGVELARPLIDEHGHRLDIDCPAAGLPVKGDRVRLAQIVANLLTNAARYGDPGGHIELVARRDGAEVHLAVRDRGIGIDAELLPRVFDLFAQGKQPKDRRIGGLGLGLAIVKSLVEQHGGRVSAHSDGPGRGSRFEVCLPAFESPAPSDASPAAAEEVAARARILVVDDNVDAAAMIGELLGDFGHDVELANDPHVALRAATARPPHLALVDIGLPGMDGHELARRLRALPALARTQLVALTGYGQPSDRERSHAAGFAEHLVKPVEAATLRRVIARLVGQAPASEPR